MSLISQELLIAALQVLQRQIPGLVVFAETLTTDAGVLLLLLLIICF